jgi:hypothetical protein
LPRFQALIKWAGANDRQEQTVIKTQRAIGTESAKVEAQIRQNSLRYGRPLAHVERYISEQTGFVNEPIVVKEQKRPSTGADKNQNQTSERATSEPLESPTNAESSTGSESAQQPSQPKQRRGFGTAKEPTFPTQS